MKINVSSFAALLLLITVPTAVADETVTLTWKRSASDDANNKTAVLTLGDGESAEAVWAGMQVIEGGHMQDPTSVSIHVSKNGCSWPVRPLIETYALGANPSTSYGTAYFQIAGPAVISYPPKSYFNPFAAAVTFKVKRVGTASPPAEVPQEAGSNFDVVLEQSSDLVNWTPANPGTYSGTETKRFFRTRIVKKP